MTHSSRSVTQAILRCSVWNQYHYDTYVVVGWVCEAWLGVTDTVLVFPYVLSGFSLISVTRTRQLHSRGREHTASLKVSPPLLCFCFLLVWRSEFLRQGRNISAHISGLSDVGAIHDCKCGLQPRSSCTLLCATWTLHFFCANSQLLDIHVWTAADNRGFVYVFFQTNNLCYCVLPSVFAPCQQTGRCSTPVRDPQQDPLLCRHIYTEHLNKLIENYFFSNFKLEDILILIEICHTIRCMCEQILQARSLVLLWQKWLMWNTGVSASCCFRVV